jgi:putative endonuclease
MAYYVYLLASKKHGTLYLGVTNDPRRQASSPESDKHDRKYGFRACAEWRIHDVQLHIGNDE